MNNKPAKYKCYSDEDIKSCPSQVDLRQYFDPFCYFFDEVKLTSDSKVKIEVGVEKKYYTEDEIPKNNSNVLKDYPFTPYDQKSWNTCPVNALCANYRLYLLVKDGIDYNPSRLYLHYHSTVLPKMNDGIQLITEAFNFFGMVEEWRWPYDPGHFNEKPRHFLYNCAKRDDECHRFIISTEEKAIKEEKAIDGKVNQLRACLHKDGAFLANFYVRNGFELKESNVIVEPPPEWRPPPLDSSPRNRKAHVVIVLGYEDRTRRFTGLGSYGPEFGDKGRFYIPYDLIEAKNNPFYEFNLLSFQRVVVPQE